MMEKQRKFQLVLPLLALPFLTLAFWALGGGKRPAGQPAAAKGIDMTLPAAQFKKEKKQDKMSVYQAVLNGSAQGVDSSFLSAMDPGRTDSAARSAERVQAKLARLNRQLNEPVRQTADRADAPQDEDGQQRVRKIRQLMQSVKSNQREDPELTQLGKMLTQLQAIQNPGSVKAPDKQPAETSPFRTVPAIVDGKQKVTDGGVVRLRLTDSVTIKNQLWPKGQLVFGSCQVTNQRLLLTIRNIRVEKDIIPVDLTVYSLDGMPGIPAPEAALAEAAGSTADNALQSMQFLSMDQSLGAQAAAGGINAAKGLFSKKVRKIKVKIKDQFPVLLKVNH